jgi:hypothetical protein
VHIRLTLIFSLIALASPLASAQVLYQTGFEAPTFVDTFLDGQDSWISTVATPIPNYGVIQNAFANTGLRSLHFDAASSLSSSWHYRPLNHTPNPISSPIVQIRWSVFVDASALAPSTLWGIDIYDSSLPVNKRILAAGIDAQGDVLGWDTTFLRDTGTTLAPNEWHDFRLDMNWRSGVNSARLIVDDQVVDIDLDFSSSLVLPISDVDILHIDGGGEDAAYFDDFSVAAYADADLDGVADPDDFCPATNPGETTDANGCTIVDDDNDGIGNQLDLCPGTPPCVTVVNASGCPTLDSDSDGAPDGCDNCPGLTEPDQTDTDGDGIGDACDPCPVLAEGDLNGDQAFNGGDIQRFSEIFLGDAPSQAEICAADFNEDTVIDFEDMPIFVNLLTTP